MYYNYENDIPLPLHILLIESKSDFLSTLKGRILTKAETPGRRNHDITFTVYHPQQLK